MHVFHYSECDTYKKSNGERETAEVIYYQIQGGGHNWPGGGRSGGILGQLNRDIDASEEIWSFFQRHELASASTRTGDIEGNGIVDDVDVDLVFEAIRFRTTSPRFDLDLSGVVDNQDKSFMVEGILQTWFGDANLDGEFNSGDLVAVFSDGHYEDRVPLNSGWAQGDWNGDGEFDSGDLVSAFSNGGFEKGPRPAAVPEPEAFAILALGGLAIVARSNPSRRK